MSAMSCRYSKIVVDVRGCRRRRPAVMWPSPRYQPSSSAYAFVSSSAASQRGHATADVLCPRALPRRWYSRRQRRIVFTETPCRAAFSESLTPASDA